MNISSSIYYFTKQALIHKTARFRKVFIRFVMIMILFFVTVCSFLYSIGFLIWALYLYLTNFISNYLSALACALIFIGIALILVLMIKRFLNSIFKFDETYDEKKIDINKEDVSKFIKDYPVEAGLTSFLAGFLSGFSPEIRKTFVEVILSMGNDNQQDKS